MKMVLESMIKHDFITQKEIDSLQRFRGATGDKFVQRLKKKMAKNKLEKWETDEKQRIENLDINRDIIKRICDNVSENVGGILGQVINDAVKNLVGTLHTDIDGLENYDNATNDFMNALQGYYRKKTAAHRV